MINDSSGLFTSDVSTKDISVIPMVVFRRNNAVVATISTNAGNMTVDDKWTYFEPILLNIPSIKESVDIETRNFKISNISLSINNFANKGQDRFSDKLSQIINSACKIYYKTPKTTSEATCLTAFEGVVTRMSHTDTTVSLNIEDRSQENLHKTIPIRKIDTNLEVLDKYKNKPIPICYGEVEDAKCVVEPADDGTANFKGYFDRTDDSGIEFYEYVDEKPEGNEANSANPLYLNGDGTKMRLQTLSPYLGSYNWSSFSYDNPLNYDISSDDTIRFIREFDSVNSLPKNSLADNILVCIFRVKPYQITQQTFVERRHTNIVLNGASEYQDYQNIDCSAQEISNKTNLIDTKAISTANWYTVGEDDNISKVSMSWNGTDYDSVWNRTIFQLTPPPNFDDMIIMTWATPLIAFKLWKESVTYTGNIPLGSSVQYLIETMGDSGDTNLSDGDYGSTWLLDYYNSVSFEASQGVEWDKANQQIMTTIWASNIYQSGSNLVKFKSKIEDMTIKYRGLVKNIFKKEIYGHIRGRAGVEGTDFLTNNIRKTWIGNNIEGYLFNEFYIMTENFYGFPYGFYFNFIDNYAYADEFMRIGDIIEYGIDDDTLEPNEYYGKVKITGLSIYGNFWYYSFDVLDGGLPIAEFPNYSDGTVKLYRCHPYIETPCDIIRHLLINEVGYDGDINSLELETARNEHKGYYLSINQTEETTTKEFIEKVAKQSKLFPKFRNDGTFGFNTIKDVYQDSDATEIDATDIISYKFSRTKLEEIKTKIKITYAKNRLLKEYLKITPELVVGDYFGDYDLGFYGLEEDSRTSALDFKAENIYEYGTAVRFRNWLMAWYCNQHNIIDLEMPLKYLKYEIGDIVKFSAIIDDVKLYGEDYTTTENRNGQDIYPYFMIISTSKNINKMSIKLIQLHANIPTEAQSFAENIGGIGKGTYMEDELDELYNINNSIKDKVEEAL